jgi:plasmid stabilization system protein ParE
MSEVRRSRQAKRDLSDIAKYIATDNAPAAERWLAGMESTFRSLASQPLIGQFFQSSRFGEIRRLSQGNYVIYFQPRANGVRVLRVLHGSRDERQLL